MYYIYVLWSSKLRKRYVGFTDKLEKRLDEHNRGSNKFTKGGIPWVEIYREGYQTKTEAIIREKFLKSGQGRAWLNEKLKDFRKDAGVV
jgi:putative endonuclease